MNEVLAQFNDFSLNVLLLLITITVKALVNLFIQTEPLRFFSWYNQRLAKKVNKSINSVKQQSIAGLIAAIVTLLPIVIILWLFADFIALPWLWHALLLYLALGDFHLFSAINNVSQALLAKQTHLAKHTLKPWVLRDVDTLSSMGLSKATIEMQLLRCLQQYFIIACYFLAIGPLMALTVRLIIEMHYCWNEKRPSFQHFGKFIATLSAIIQWFPSRVFSLLLVFSALTSNASLFAQAYKKHCYKLNNDIVLHLFALKLNIQLAGVAIYEQKKLRRVSFNQSAPQPQASDIKRAYKLILQLLYFALALTISLAILTIVLH
jgi:adenosylcobinamide-phosphate synthase